jgi:hypothetical protein
VAPIKIQPQNQIGRPVPTERPITNYISAIDIGPFVRFDNLVDCAICGDGRNAQHVFRH